MNHRIIFFLSLPLFLLSCAGNMDNGEIELDNGAKWEVNTEMMPPLKTSINLISDFASNNEKDYKALAEKLKENNKVLISSCTMEGKSHEELHKWLHPYINLVDELANAKNEQKADEVFLKIKQSFETFNQYFQ